jgi:hypothetical protein
MEYPSMILSGAEWSKFYFKRYRQHPVLSDHPDDITANVEFLMKHCRHLLTGNILDMEVEGPDPQELAEARKQDMAMPRSR